MGFKELFKRDSGRSILENVTVRARFDNETGRFEIIDTITGKIIPGPDFGERGILELARYGRRDLGKKKP